jgi:hypothetical protein
MCIDYTSLSKACPKDPFPLPRIDQVVYSMAGCEALCFLDTYPSDQLVTSFITPFNTFLPRVNAFRLAERWGDHLAVHAEMLP